MGDLVTIDSLGNYTPTPDEMNRPPRIHTPLEDRVLTPGPYLTTTVAGSTPIAHTASGGCERMATALAAGAAVGSVDTPAADDVWPCACISVAPPYDHPAFTGRDSMTSPGVDIDPPDRGDGSSRRGTRTGSGPVPDGTPGTDGVPTPADVDDWFARISRKCTPDEMTPGLVKFATAWARDYSGTFAFMVDMRAAAGSRRGLSTGQAKGVLNCYRADIGRRETPRSIVTESPADETPTEPTTPTETPAAITPGMYHGGDGGIYRVQAAKGSGNLYGKLLTSTGYEYAPGSMRTIRAGRRMTPAEAADYGRRTGTCCVCARELTRDESIAAGIGPVCASRV